MAAARLALDLGAAQPTGAASRIMRLFRRSGLPAAAFWSGMREAVRQVRQCTIKVNGEDGEPNALPLFLTILQRLLDGRPQPGGWPERRSREIGGAATRPQQQSAPEITESHPVWRGVLEHLQGILTPGNFQRCLASHVAEQAGTTLRIVVPGTFEQMWWTRQLGRHVAGALAEYGLESVQVAFVVETTGESAV
jgi:hypothetical protein